MAAASQTEVQLLISAATSGLNEIKRIRDDLVAMGVDTSAVDAKLAALSAQMSATGSAADESAAGLGVAAGAAGDLAAAASAGAAGASGLAVAVTGASGAIGGAGAAAAAAAVGFEQTGEATSEIADAAGDSTDQVAKLRAEIERIKATHIQAVTEAQRLAESFRQLGITSGAAGSGISQYERDTIDALKTVAGAASTTGEQLEQALIVSLSRVKSADGIAELEQQLTALSASGRLTQDQINEVRRQAADLAAQAGQTAGGLVKMDAAMSRLKAGLAALASGATVAALGGLLVAAQNSAAETASWAEKLGLTVERLSALQQAAASFRIEGDQFTDGLQTLTERIIEVGLGSEDATEGFKQLGVSVVDANGNIKSTEQVLYDLADAFENTTDYQTKLQAALVLFGDEAGSKFVGALNQGADGLKRLADEAERSGRVITQDQAEAAKEASKQMSELKSSFGLLSVELGTQFGPTMVSVIESFTNAVQKAGDLAARLGWIERAVGGLSLKDALADYTTAAEELGEASENLAYFQNEIARLMAAGVPNTAPTIVEYTNVVKTLGEEKARLEGRTKALGERIEEVSTRQKEAAAATNNNAQAQNNQRQSTESLAKSLLDLGVDTDIALGKVGDTVRAAVKDINNIAASAESTGDIIEEALGGAFARAKTEEDIARLQLLMFDLEAQGKLTGENLAAAQRDLAAALQAVLQNTDSAVAAFDTLGEQAPQVLETISEQARAAWTQMQAVEENTDTLRAGFLAFADAELAAADASGREADASLRQQAAALGLTEALTELKTKYNDTNAELAALTAQHDRARAVQDAAAQASIEEARAQQAAADATLAKAQQLGNERLIGLATNAQRQAGIAVAKAEAQAAREAAAATAAKVAAMEKEIAAGGDQQQQQQLNILKEQARQQNAAAAAAQSRVVVLEAEARAAEKAALANRRHNDTLAEAGPKIRDFGASVFELAGNYERSGGVVRDFGTDIKDLDAAFQKNRITGEAWGNFVNGVFDALGELSDRALEKFKNIAPLTDTQSDALRTMKAELIELQTRAKEGITIGGNIGLDNWLEQARAVKQEFLQTAINVERLRIELENAGKDGVINMQLLREATEAADGALDVMDERQLEGLRAAIADAQRRFDELADRIESRTASFQERLLKLQGKEEGAELLRLNRDIEEQRLQILRDQQSATGQQQQQLQEQLALLDQIRKAEEERIKQQQQQRQQQQQTPPTNTGGGSGSGSATGSGSSTNTTINNNVTVQGQLTDPKTVDAIITAINQKIRQAR